MKGKQTLTTTPQICHIYANSLFLTQTMPVVVPVRHTHQWAQKQLDIYTFSRLKVDREVESNKAQKSRLIHTVLKAIMQDSLYPQDIGSE